MRHLILPRTLPGCHGNEIWDKVGYNSACVKDIFEIFGSMGGYGDGPSNASNCISPGRLHLPWQRNLGQNWLYLALCKRYLRNFCAYRGGGVSGISQRMLPIEFYPDWPSLQWKQNLG